MKKTKVLGVVLLLAVIILATAFFFVQRKDGAPVPGGEDVSAYVSEHISELSPEKAVLGGTFYVTDIRASNGEGVVEYEDGHVAFKADFTYTFDRNGEVIIKSFIIRD